MYIIFWQDYPILATVPTTSFSCVGKAEGGYYADVETGCQVKLSNDGNHKIKMRFLVQCNGGVFNYYLALWFACCI